MNKLIRPRKRFAQHWLRSQVALDSVLDAAELQAEDRVLEIGPGTGILTNQLLTKVQSVVAVEIDRDLCYQLVKRWGSRDNFLLLQGDILSLDLAVQLINFPAFQNPNKVVANIPYNITGPILEKLLGTIANPVASPYESIVLLIQKEVAERLAATPGTKAFGALTVRVQYLATTELIANVPRQAFSPPPQVDSAIVRLRPHRIFPPANNPKLLDTLVKLGFASRRKMLYNNLRSIINNNLLLTFLENLNIVSQSRAEDISLQDWISLSNYIDSATETILKDKSG